MAYHNDPHCVSVSPPHAVTLQATEAVPSGAKKACRPQNPEPEPAIFLNVGLPFFAMDNGGKFLPGDNDKLFLDSWPVISVGGARGRVRHGSLSTTGSE